MMIPQFFDDLTGIEIPESELCLVQTLTAKDERAECHFSRASFNHIFSSLHIGVGEILRLLREKQFISIHDTITSSNQCVMHDNGTQITRYIFSISWKTTPGYDMPKLREALKSIALQNVLIKSPQLQEDGTIKIDMHWFPEGEPFEDDDEENASS